MQSDWITASERAQTRSFATSSYAHFGEPSRFLFFEIHARIHRQFFQLFKVSDFTLYCAKVHYNGFSKRDGFYGSRYCKRFVEEIFLRYAT